ncbi:MAG TPA: glycoside hydrolase family 13 protein [Dermatophilaceae bacterium]
MTAAQPPSGRLASVEPVPERSDLLSQPHHDGSALYVSDQRPRPGDAVIVRIRIPREADVSTVRVRVTPDAEPVFVDAVPDRWTETETWWRAEITCHNPVTGYRFLLGGETTPYQWLNGTGVHQRDVPDAADFRLVTFDGPPPWAADAVVYQVFPDRFARSADGPDRPAPDWAVPADWDDSVDLSEGAGSRQLYGGDLGGVVEHLDHLQSLGVNVLYLTPIFAARSNHRYDASSFRHVDPVLGGDEALTRLTHAAHARGMKVLGDFTANHTGDSHEWFQNAQADPECDERGFYFWEDGGYASWLGVKSLPKLNYASELLRQRVFEDNDGVVRKWMTGPDGLDGWRVDVANMTGRHRKQDLNHEVAAQMRRAMHDVKPASLLIGEHCHDFTLDAGGDGWDGVMNYAGFTRPVWTWLRAKDLAPKFLGAPLLVPRLGGQSVMETMREFSALAPWRSIRHSFNLVGSHDTTRIRTLVGQDSREVDVAAGLLLTMPGIPMITYGDEIGMRGDSGEDGRRPMPWISAVRDDAVHADALQSTGRSTGRWDARVLEVYRGLILARNLSHALRHGGLRWVHADDDVLVFLRESTEETALIHCARAAHAPIRVATRHLTGVADARVAYGRDLLLDGDSVVLLADKPEVSIWTWPRG